MKKLEKDLSADPLMPETFPIYLKKLEADGDHQQALYVLIHVSTGLRYSDIQQITVRMIKENLIIINEKKTGKITRRKFDESVWEKALVYLHHLDINDDSFIIKGKFSKTIHINTMNERLKRDKLRYDLPINNFSTHSFRKCFGRMVFMANGSGESAYFMLSAVFNHSSIAYTKRYLKITQEELMEFAATIKIS